MYSVTRNNFLLVGTQETVLDMSDSVIDQGESSIPLVMITWLEMKTTLLGT
jgi:hypothetical protein